MKLITWDDIIETYAKFNEVKRAKTAFNHKEIQSSNWWIIPMVKERWNNMITGNKNQEFVDFTVNTFLKDKQNLKMLSLGSGNCASELKFASFNNFDEIICSDISEILLRHAEEVAKNEQLENIKFQVDNANTFSFPKNYYDIVYFRASLHHFKNIDELIGKHVYETLKYNGLIIIDEYVGPNRVQFPNHQIKAINKAIQLIPKKYRKRFNLNCYKNSISGSGIIRMKIADPSECIESEKILPAIHKHYKAVYEGNYGGNLLMTALKDIAHHFIEIDDEKKKILNKLFEFEDDYIKNNPSDFVFGIYEKFN